MIEWASLIVSNLFVFEIEFEKEELVFLNQ